MPSLNGTPGPRVKATSVGTHYLRYSTANLAVLLAGFVSFPLLTRLLDNTQYGILGYFETWVALAVALLKFGSQHSVMRLYPHGADATQLRQFATNMVAFPILAMLAGWSLVAFGMGLTARMTSYQPGPVVWCAVFLVPLVAISSFMEIVLQASERSMLLMVTRVCKRWLELGLIVAALIVFERSALAVYGAKVAGGALLTGFYVIWLLRNFEFSRSRLDGKSIRASLLYGSPLLANELAWVLLDAIDRVMIKHLLGSFAAVGIYTIGYSLAINVRLFMSATLLEAFVPVANRKFELAGPTAVVALKDTILLPMTYASIGVSALLIGVGQEGLVALSGPDKSASGTVFMAVGVAFAIYPLLSVSGYGLLLQKRSTAVFFATLAAVVLNITLNFVLIPRMGIMGAVWSSVISYAAVALINCWQCPPELRRFPRFRTVLLALAFASVFLGALQWLKPGPSHPWQSLCIAGLLFAALYLGPIWWLDSGLRQAMRSWRER